MRLGTPRHGRAGIGLVGAIVFIAVILAAVGAGVMVAMAATGDAGAGGEGNEGVPSPEEISRKHAYVPFGPMIVNLNVGRLTRYLKVTLALKVEKEKADKLTDILEGDQKAILQDWLICYLSDQALDDVKGATRIRSLRREIRLGFNEQLAEVSDIQLAAVLFTEFNVQ